MLDKCVDGESGGRQNRGAASTVSLVSYSHYRRLQGGLGLDRGYARTHTVLGPGFLPRRRQRQPSFLIHTSIKGIIALPRSDCAGWRTVSEGLTADAAVKRA